MYRHGPIAMAIPLLFLAGLVAGPMGAEPPIQDRTGPPSIVPLPAEIRWTEGAFRIGERTAIRVEGPTEAAGRLLAEELSRASGLAIGVLEAEPGDPPRDSIGISILESPDGLGPEGYALSIGPEAVRISASDPAGAFWAVQTLRQLLPVEAAGARPDGSRGCSLPAVEIRDRPRFGWRGLMLDCSRTFQSMDYLRRTVDRMALYKLNVLHLHLTDDQGWRLEIEKRPALTREGARFPERFGEPQSTQGFYSQDEIRELVRYAAERHVSVVPEIEMPGHSLAALSCYPELSCTGGPFEIYPFFQGPGITEEIFCAGREESFEFFADVLDEVVGIFPSPFVHVGGDEVPKRRWKECPRCQARMREEGLADVHELQSWFIRRAEGLLEARGRRLIGWDEILEGGLAPRAAVMSWRGTAGGIAAARAGHAVVMSPTSHCYFDYSYRTTSTRRVFDFEPVPAELSEAEARHVLGLQANFWSHIDRVPERVDAQLFPRLLALAERAWSPAAARDFAAFRERLLDQRARLDALGVRWHLPALLEPAGRWTPEGTPEGFEEMEWDVGAAVEGGGSLRVLFQYTGGAHRLEIRRVALLRDGEEVSRDEHEGVTGARDVDNLYSLEVPAGHDDARWVLRALARGGGGTDSSGELYLHLGRGQP